MYPYNEILYYEYEITKTLLGMSCYVWVLQRRNSGNGYGLPSTMYMYDLRKGDLFVLSWARVRRVSQGSISSEWLVCLY